MRTKASSPGGGAVQSRKLLAAMAVLAVAFVVLAAVPVALTDSDAATGQKVSGTVTDLTSSGTPSTGTTWNYSGAVASGTATAVTADATFILEEGKGFNVRGTAGTVKITFYIGEKSGTDYYYQPATKIVFTVGGTNGVKVTANDDGSYTVVIGSDSSISNGITAKIGSTTKAYNAAVSKNFYANTNADAVTLAIPVSTGSSDKVTTGFTVSLGGTEAAPETKVVVKAQNTSTVSLTLTNRSGVLNAGGAYTAGGYIQIDAGSLVSNAGGSSATDASLIAGKWTRTGESSSFVHTWTPITSSNSITKATEQLLRIPAGASVSDGTVVQVGTAQVTLNNFTVVSDQVNFTMTGANAMAVANKTAGYKTQWQGTLQVDTVGVTLSTVEAGDVDVKASYVTFGTPTIYGKVTFADDSFAVVGSSAFTIPSTTEFSGTLKTSTSSGKTFALTNVKGIYSSTSSSDGVGIAYSSSTLTLTKSGYTGSIVTTDASQKASVTGIIGDLKVTDELSETGAVSFMGAVEAGTMKISQNTDFYGKTVTIGSSGSGALTITADKIVAISANTTLKATVTADQGTWDVLGKIDGTVTASSSGKVNTPDKTNESGAHIKTLAGATLKTAIASVSTELQFERAVSMGYLYIRATALTVADGSNLSLPSEMTMYISGALTVNAGANFTNEGNIFFTGDAGSLVLSAASGSKKAGFTNEGELGILTTGRTTDDFQAALDAGTEYILTISAGSTFVNGKTMTFVDADADNTPNILGLFENNGVLNLKTPITIGNGTGSELEFQNSGEIYLGKTGMSSGETAYITVNAKAVLYNSGIIAAASDADAIPTIAGKGTYNNQKDGVVGVPVYTSEVKGTTYTVVMSSDVIQTQTYMGLQIVQVPSGSALNIIKTAKMTVQGKLVIDGDLIVKGKLIIDAGNGNAKAAEIVVNGTITIADGGELVIGGESNSAEMTVAEGASITVQKGGVFDIGAAGSAEIKGTLTMDGGSDLTVVTAQSLEIASTGSATLAGYIVGAVSIKNLGTVTINNGANKSKASGTLTINMAADGAMVVIDSYLAAAQLKITDNGLVTSTNSAGETASSIGTNCNEITISASNSGEASTVGTTTSVVNGKLTVVEYASAKNVKVDGEPKKAQTYDMDISGEISGKFTYSGTAPEAKDVKSVINLALDAAVYEDYGDSKETTKNDGYMAVTSDLTLGDYVVLSIGSKTSDVGGLKVSANITATSSYSKTIKMDSDGILTVTGKVVASSKIDNSAKGTINAVEYETATGTGKDKVSVYNYSTLDKAIEDILASTNTADKNAYIMGAAVVKESISVPAGLSIEFADRNATLAVGSSDDRSVVLAFEDGASLETVANSQVTVYGTLTFDDKTDDKTAKTVSDVTYESDDDNGYRTYTNIQTAVAEAGQQGEDVEITVTRAVDQGAIEITSNLLIPSNVTLVVPDSSRTAGLKLMDGVTLTIDGTLKSSQAITAEHIFQNAAYDTTVGSTTYASSAIVVNGALITSSEISYGVKVASESVAFMKAPIYGVYFQTSSMYVISGFDYAMENVSSMISGMTVNGPVTASDSTFTPNTVVTTITVSNATVAPYGPSAGTTAVASSLTVSSLTLAKGASVLVTENGYLSGTVVVGDASVVTEKIVGSLKIANSSDAMVLTGTAKAADKTSMKIAGGSVSLGSSSAQFNYESSKVYLTVASGASAKAANNSLAINMMDVAGSLEIPSGMTVTVNKLKVSGSIKTAPATDSSAAGSLVINTEAYIGMTSSDIGAAASVSGPFTLKAGSVMYVASGSTIDADVSALKSTEFYNGGSLWFTAYAADDSTSITVSKAPVQNVKFKGWASKQDATEGSTSVTVGKSSKMYAVVETEIYTIIIKADTGIGDLYLNGNIMQKGQISKDGYAYTAFWATVSYGTYEVTCKLANGYSGTAVLKDSTGAALSGNKLTTPKASDYETVNFQLTGIEKSGYVQPTEEKDDSGLTVTDYLLIVLVILVVVLAVIVALRLMRS